MISVAVIGCGHWGPNHIRVFSQLPNSKCVLAADIDEGRLKAIKSSYPTIETTTDHHTILERKDIDAVCIAAPTKFHYKFAKEALEAGKHVLCEKPLAMTVEECLDLGEVAKKQSKILMVGHVFLFNSGIKWVKDYIDSGEIGRVFYAHSERTNLGPFRYDVNALWDLAPHDISIFDHLLGGGAVSASARGHKCLGNDLEDISFATLDYPNGIMGNIHVSWVDPRKVRQITIVGEKKMIVWDDLDTMGSVRVYDKYVERTNKYYESYGEFHLLMKEGAITIPKIAQQEPLKAQGQYFVDRIEKGEPPQLADAQKAAAVVRALSAIQGSMDKMGELVKA